MTNGPPSDVWLGHLIHLDRRHDPGLDLAFLQGILQSKRINYRGQHAHMVRGNTVHHASLFGNTTEEIPSTHHNGDFNTEVPDCQDLERNLMQLSDVYPEAAVGRQRFTRQFEQDSLVHSCKVSHIQDGPLSLGRRAIYPPFAATLTVLNLRRKRRAASFIFGGVIATTRTTQ